MGLAVVAACLPASLVRAQRYGAVSESQFFAGQRSPLNIDPNPQAMRLTAAFFFEASAPSVGTLRSARRERSALRGRARHGRIHVFENRDDVPATTIFLDIRTRVQSTGQEQGLLGLAFDPDYANNRLFL